MTRKLKPQITLAIVRAGQIFTFPKLSANLFIFTFVDVLALARSGLAEARMALTDEGSWVVLAVAVAANVRDLFALVHVGAGPVVLGVEVKPGVAGAFEAARFVDADLGASLFVVDAFVDVDASFSVHSKLETGRTQTAESSL